MHKSVEENVITLNLEFLPSIWDIPALMYSLCFQNALYNYTKCATKFEQRFDPPPLNNVKKTTLLEREGFPYQGSLSANKLWRAFVVCPRWKEKTNNNTVRGGYHQTCSRETGREGATMDPFLSFVYFYRTSKEDAILERGPWVAIGGRASDQGALASIYEWEEVLFRLAHLTQHRLLAGGEKSSDSMSLEDQSHF